MWDQFVQAVSSCLELFLPACCILCGKELDNNTDLDGLCSSCLLGCSALHSAHCPQCLHPFPNIPKGHLCSRCLNCWPAFSSVTAVGQYRGTLKEAIHRLKFNQQVILASPLSSLLLETLSIAQPNALSCIIPVPMALCKLRSTGYNHALEIARPLARELNLKLEKDLLHRVNFTKPQKGLTALGRRKNLKNSFMVNRLITGHKVLLVDDIMTTGETARACSRALKDAGAAEVHVAVIGRA